MIEAYTRVEYKLGELEATKKSSKLTTYPVNGVILLSMTPSLPVMNLWLMQMRATFITPGE
jgi:hypothetical protein